MCGGWPRVQAVFQKMLEKPIFTGVFTSAGFNSNNTFPPDRSTPSAAWSSRWAT